MEISQPTTTDEDYDAANALFQRGALLRKLRELEREDEASRQQELDTDDNDKVVLPPSDTLYYPDYIANQRGIYDDYKHVNYPYVNFGDVGGTPLVIAQDRSVGKGGLIWDAGYVLAQSIIRNKDEWLLGDRPQRVVELGSGTGITGIMIARTFPMSKVHLTDLPQLQPLLEKNTKHVENATYGVLEWGKPVNETYDVILGADVVAGIYDSQALVKSLFDLAHENTRIYLSARERLSGLLDTFELDLKERFATVERRMADSDNKNPSVFIICISGKRRFQ